MKGATWSIDFAIGMMIFILAAALSVSLITNYVRDDRFDDVRITGNAISEDLVSTGFPTTWTPANAITIGLSSDNRLDVVKYAQFTSMPYEDAKKLFSSTFDFYVLIRNYSGIVNLGVCGYGHPSVTVDVNCEPTFPTAKDITISRRIILIGPNIHELDVYAWR